VRKCRADPRATSRVHRALGESSLRRSRFAPVGFGALRRRRLLVEDDRRRPAFDDLSGVRVLDFANHGIALGGLQIEPKAAVIMPPEGLLEGGAVLRVAQHGGDQAPRLDRIGVDLIVIALAVRGFARSMDQIADRLKVV
jgi:hypothetical protein